jgi:hypothetical protein
MKRIFTNYYNYFFDSSVINPSFLIFFRISFGILCIFYFYSFQYDFDSLFGLKTILPSRYHIEASKMLFSINQIERFFETYGVSSTICSSILLGLAYLSCTMIVVGFYGRAAAVYLLLFIYSYAVSFNLFAFGVDTLFGMTCFYILLLPVDDYCSIRSHFGMIKYKSDLSPFYKLLQIHVAIIYFTTGLNKFFGDGWFTGENMWKLSFLPSFSNIFHIDKTGFVQYPIVYMIAGGFTVLSELLHPFLMYWKKTRKVALIAIVLLHLGIIVVMNLFYFGFVMIILNIAAFGFDARKESELRRY